MPEYAVLIYAEDSAHAPGAVSPEKAECDAHAEEMAARSMVWAYALTPRDMAVSVVPGGSRPGPLRADGPVVAGFYILEAPDLESAVAMAATNPAVHSGAGVEVRPVHSGGAVER